MSPAEADVARALADPRPVVVPDGERHLLEGGRCRACGHALVLLRPLCPRCGSEVDHARFGPGGTLWAVTVVHVAASADDEVPYTMGYIDLNDGPRVLVRVDDTGGVARVGAAVRLTASTLTGNPAAEVVA